ncbi:MAG: glycosyltransferase family 39 protein [Alphaproteobacteria bacterium]|nr:glycosyltransferase family 39 protein [Alphaproteobacteria bacterium]
MKHKIKFSFFSEKHIMWAIGLLAFCFYVLFNYAVPFDYFNHDLGGLNADHGHMGYMWHIWKNWSLPVFSIDPATQESYYNPPLHYVLSALWIRCTLFFTDSFKTGFESLQILTSIYMGITLIFFYRILFLLKIKHKILCWVYFCFNPMLFIMSSIVNNDGLSFLTTLATFYYGLKWYKDQLLKTMIIAALFTGLGLMTKLNGVLIIAVLALIFMIRFFKDKKKRKNYIYQLLIYLLIALPIGGWYYGYAYFRYHTPVNYVQGWKDPHSDIGSKHTLLERFTNNEWSDIYVDLGSDKNWNMWALGLKTSVFDEHRYQDNSIIYFFANFLFYFSVFFFFSICIFSLGYILYKPILNWQTENIIFIFYIILFLTSFIHFNYYFPHPWTANFRYMPTFFACAICLWNKIVKDKTLLFYFLPFAVAFSSIAFYGVLIYQRLF